MKNNIKYILILAIGFLWCSLAYLSQELIFLKFYSNTVTNNVIMTYDSFAMAFGILLFIYLYKRGLNTKKIYIIFLIASFIINILFYVININELSKALSILLCFFGSAGFGCAYHFSLITVNVKKEKRGLTFACGYAIGAFLTYLISLIPNNFSTSSNLLIITSPLILANIYLIYRTNKLIICKKDEGIETPYNKKKKIFLILIIFIMSIIASLSSNMFAMFNYNIESGFAYSRIYYAVGLIIAGIIADKNSKAIDMLTIISLFYPLVSIILLKEQIDMKTLANFNYFFLSFFVIFRTISFMNLNSKNKIYLASFGLCICRLVEGLLSLINSYIEFSYLFLIISIIILFSIMIIIYFYLHSLNNLNKEDVFEEFCIQYKLSIQEKKILNLMIQDYSNQDMADYLVVSINTIRNHVAHIYKKCNMKKNQIKEIITKKTI